MSEERATTKASQDRAGAQLLSDEERADCQIMTMAGAPHGQRAAALLAIDEGMTQSQAAERTDLSIGQVRYWLGKYRKMGLAIFPKDQMGATVPEVELEPKEVEASKTLVVVEAGPEPAAEPIATVPYDVSAQVSGDEIVVKKVKKKKVLEKSKTGIKKGKKIKKAKETRTKKEKEPKSGKGEKPKVKKGKGKKKKSVQEGKGGKKKKGRGGKGKRTNRKKASGKKDRGKKDKYKKDAGNKAKRKDTKGKKVKGGKKSPRTKG